jgi:hypothetical protein
MDWSSEMVYTLENAKATEIGQRNLEFTDCLGPGNEVLRITGSSWVKLASYNREKKGAQLPTLLLYFSHGDCGWGVSKMWVVKFVKREIWLGFHENFFSAGGCGSTTKIRASLIYFCEHVSP